MNALEPATYPTVDSWRESAMRRADINPGELAKRCLELMQRRRPGKALVFVVFQRNFYSYQQAFFQ